MTRVFARSILEKLHQRRSAGVRGMAGPRARGGRGVLAFRTKGETRRNAREGGGGEGRRATSDERSASPPKKSVCVQSHFLPSLGRRVTFADQPSSASHGTARLAPPDGRGADAATRRVAPGARAGPFPFPASASRASRDEGTRARGVRVSRLPRRVARVRLARRSIVQVANDDGSFAGVSPRRRRDPVSSPPRGFPVSGFRARDRRRADRRFRSRSRVRPARAHARAQESKLARGLSEEKRDSAGVVVRAAGSRARRWPKKSRALNSSSGD